MKIRKPEEIGEKKGGKNPTFFAEICKKLLTNPKWKCNQACISVPGQHIWLMHSLLYHFKVEKSNYCFLN